MATAQPAEPDAPERPYNERREFAAIVTALLVWMAVLGGMVLLVPTAGGGIIGYVGAQVLSLIVYRGMGGVYRGCPCCGK